MRFEGDDGRGGVKVKVVQLREYCYLCINQNTTHVQQHASNISDPQLPTVIETSICQAHP